MPEFEVGAEYQEESIEYGVFTPVKEYMKRKNADGSDVKDERGKPVYVNQIVCTFEPQKLYTSKKGRGQVIFASFVDYVYADYNTGEPVPAIRYKQEIFDLDARGFPVSKEGKGKSTMHPVLFEKHLLQTKQAEEVYRKKIKPWMVEKGLLPPPQEKLPGEDKGKHEKEKSGASPSSPKKKQLIF